MLSNMTLMREITNFFVSLPTTEAFANSTYATSFLSMIFLDVNASISVSICFEVGLGSLAKSEMRAGMI
jgi:hypothetical protein